MIWITPIVRCRADKASRARLLLFLRLALFIVSEHPLKSVWDWHRKGYAEPRIQYNRMVARTAEYTLAILIDLPIIQCTFVGNV